MIKFAKSPIAVLSLSALAFVSCKKDDKAGTAGDMMRFTASIDNGGAKTAIDAFNNVKWSEKDSIFINGEVFHSELEGNGETAVFTGPTLEGTEYTAYFRVEKEEDAYELPETQTYNKENANDLSGINPMYAYSTTTELQFHHICGLLKLDVKGEGKVNEIKVSKKDVALCGPFIITENRAVVSSTNDSVVTLNCGEGEALNADNAKTFYIALPQGNYTDLNLEFKGGKVWKTKLSVNIKAGQIRTKELTGVSTIPVGAVSGEFTINDNDDKVYFSKGNLQYCATGSSAEAASGESVGGTWRFADNQWSYIGQDNKNISQSYGGWIDLFGWGTSGYNHNGASYQPWSNDTGKDAYTKYYAYGNPSSNLYDAADWGYSYCKQEEIEPYTTWRTLSNAEWDYLLNTRIVKGGTKYGNTCVWATLNNDVKGLIIFPDDYTGDTENLDYIPDGCVFLPAAGSRGGTNVLNGGLMGLYWSSSSETNIYAYHLSCNSGSEEITHAARNNGMSVRLVCDAEN